MKIIITPCTFLTGCGNYTITFIDIGKGVEIQIHVDSVKTKGHVGRNCDDSTLLRPDITQSQSIVKRYDGRAAHGKGLPDVI